MRMTPSRHEAAMRWFPRVATWSTRNFHAPAFTKNLGAESAPVSISGHELDLLTFRQQAFLPQRPLLINDFIKAPHVTFPASKKWFHNATLSPENPHSDAISSFSPYMDQFQDWPFPYELMMPSKPAQVESISRFQTWLSCLENSLDQALAGMLEPVLEDSSRGQRFFQLYAPLRLLIKTLQYNKILSDQGLDPIQLYIAQSSISSLPPALQMDLPTPKLVSEAGKGDVYDSSVWLGSEPTYTPLHRDPNPNLFCQLCGSKALRILPPAGGDFVFSRVQARLGRRGSSRIRTTDMMEGEEREMLHNMVWGDDVQGQVIGMDVRPGDAVFVPKGWWHSVRSVGEKGHLNGSVNWWFR